MSPEASLTSMDNGCYVYAPSDAARAAGVRFAAARDAFAAWTKSGDWHDLLAGIAEIARRARELEAV